MTTLRDGRTLSAARIFGAFCVVALAGGCADSTIHTKDNVGGVDTLSLDAKQRLVFVADRAGQGGDRITCTEPMPDALVARAAVLAASGTFSRGADLSAGAGAGGSSESAASIGFRNETVQMLRDGYYRLCEAYMNGALTKKQYQHMILNADTFMVVVSALQTLGTNPVTPAVTINAGGVTATAPKDGTSATATVTAPSGETTKVQTISGTTTGALNAKNAQYAAQIVKDYLRYRMILAQAIARDEARDRARRWHK